MANHYRVSPKFWLKARKRGWTDEQTTLGLYLLTCEHRNLEGLYRLPKPYAAADLGWPLEKLETALAVVCSSGFAAYDEDAEMVLIPKALKHQAPSTDRHVQGAIAQLERIPHTTLWDGFRIACQSHCPKLADAIQMRWPSDTDAISRTHATARGDISSSISSSSPQAPAGGAVRFRRRPVPPSQVTLAEQILTDFNQQAGTNYGPYTASGAPSEALRRLLGAVTEHPDALTLPAAHELTRRALEHPWWEGPPSAGVVFGPNVIERNLAALTTASNGRTSNSSALVDALNERSAA